MDTWFFKHTSLHYLREVEQRENYRVLLAGNGISPEPYGFAHAGCNVTVVDVSAVACRFLRSLQVTPELLSRMFTVYDDVLDPDWNMRVRRPSPEKSLQLVDAEYRPSGCVSIIAADLFNYEPTQPFDAVFSRRAYQGLPLDRREELARRFYRWLRPGGFAFVEMRLVCRHKNNPREM
jgi:SAM-dependent methyltransferase